MPSPATIYDISSLQVHAEGRRVKQKRDQRPTSLGHLSYLIAKDAGGLPTKVSRKKGLKNRKKRKRDEENVNGGEDFSNALNDLDGENLGEGLSKQDENEVIKESSKTAKDRRTIKKRRYEQDMDYLNDKQLSTTAIDPEAFDDFPSSDLLKNIHYFAAQFYHSRGQLYNHANRLRKADYKRRREKQKLETVGEDEDEGEKEPELEVDEGEEAADNDISESEQTMNRRSKSRFRSHRVRKGLLEKLPPQKGKYVKVSVRRKEAAASDRFGNWEPDMYKSMDGSALVCLGMLMQEYIKWQVKSRIPDNWEGLEVSQEAIVGEENEEIEGNRLYRVDEEDELNDLDEEAVESDEVANADDGDGDGENSVDESIR